MIATTAPPRDAASANRLPETVMPCERHNASAVPTEPERFLEHMDVKLSLFLARLAQSDIYRLMVDPRTDGRLVVALVKHYLLEAFSFGPHVTEATFTAIGRFPKERPDLMRPLILLDLEEVDHGEMALRDYLQLGGDERHARCRPLSPVALVLAATCRMLAERGSPYCYLGYMYLLEALTPALAERMRQVMAARGFTAGARGFIDFHAAADVAHTRHLRQAIAGLVAAYPEAAAAIDYGFTCFSCVYPLPIWAAALERAREEVRKSDTTSKPTER